MSPYYAKVVSIACCWILFCSLFLILGNKRFVGETKGRLLQHGDFWVWHDFIRGGANLSGNQSITLTTHATHVDLSLLPELLHRWQAPISVAIYACGEDFDQTVQALRFLYMCPKHNEIMLRLISVHLVFHNRHIPRSLRDFDKSLKLDPLSCDRASSGLTYSLRKGLGYPVSLLRNVARTNAPTYYILALDLHFLPSNDFVNMFLNRFIWKHNISTPHKTVYCLAPSPRKSKPLLAKSRRQLVNVSQIFNQSDLPSYKNLTTGLNVLGTSKKSDTCVGYVSINELKPPYIEKYPMESISSHSSNLKNKLLAGLNYTFINLDGGFLIRRTFNDWNRVNRTMITNK